VIDVGLPNAVCAFVITVRASCAIAFPHRDDTQIAASASFVFTAIPPLFNVEHQVQLLAFYMLGVAFGRAIGG
jgi:hypothetical protein